MKQFVLLAFLTLSTIFTAAAQSEDSDTTSNKFKFDWGLKAGMNRTTLEHTYGPATTGFHGDRGYGIVGGLWGRYGNSLFFVQPEIYIQKRSAIIHDTTTLSSNGTFLGTRSETNNATFTSVDIPVLLGTKFGMKGIATVRLNTGPVVELVTSKKQSVGTETDEDESPDIAHINYRTVNYAWQFGAGVDLWRFGFDVRYLKAFNSFTTYSGDSMKFKELNFTLSFRLSH